MLKIVNTQSSSQFLGKKNPFLTNSEQTVANQKIREFWNRLFHWNAL